MPRIILITLLFIFTGCADKISSSELQFLNGYWEIEKVVFPDGDTREYSLSTTIDYIALEGGKGYKKKVQPRLDGSFLTSDDAVAFEITALNGTFTLHYSNEYDAWEEQLIAISEQKFAVVNKDNIRYYYRRYESVRSEQ